MSLAGKPGRVALVTGASSGIGLELAKLFAKDGWHVVLTARDAPRLEGLAAALQRQHGASTTIITADLSVAGVAEEIARRLKQDGFEVDALVNNAGFGSHGPFAESDIGEQLRMIQVNVTALTHLTGLLLPGMVTRGAGRVLNVASTAAFQPGPMMAVYYATKAYVLSFSEALANELQGTGVTVTALCPGPTTTEFQRRAGVGHTKMMSGRIATAASVALAGYHGLMAGRTLVIPGLRNRFLACCIRLLPRTAAAAVVRSIQDQRAKASPA